MVSGPPDLGRPMGAYDTPPPPQDCAGCGGAITDRFYLHAADRQWHVSCLMCHRCKAPLDKEMTCFSKDGHIYCKEDYCRLFGVKRCSRCQHGIFASELVMRARDLVFHLHCFTCAWCNAALTQGDHFGLRAGLVYCRPHFELLSADLHAGEHGDDFCGDRPYPAPQPRPEDLPYAAILGGGGGRKGRPRKKKGSEENIRHGPGLSPLDPGNCGLHLSPLDAPPQSSPPLSSNQGRTKRMRTSFKHHQLRTMKSYFALNQNPDAKDLKQLAQKTGLSKRVLQVWFQNARAKWRRSNVKQDSMHPGMLDQPHTPQMHQGGHMGLCSPGATSSYSEPSPVHSCGQSDGSISTHIGGQALDFDSSNPPVQPILSQGDSVMHITSFHELF